MKYFHFVLGLSLVLLILAPADINGQSKTTLPYILEEPDRIKADELYPLVVCLHGAGGRGSENSGKGSQAYNILKRRQYKKEYPSYLLVPQCPKGQQWVDTPWRDGNYDIDKVEISDELEFVLKLIDSVIDDYPIDKSRIYITGQSMGGFGTWDLIIRKPELFACAIPVCGGGDPSKADLIKHIPIWIFHGSKDNIVPVKASRDMYESLKKISDNVKYMEFKEVEHGSWVPAWRDKKMIDWMYQQKVDNEYK